MEKFLLTIEFRYVDIPDEDRSKTITIGVFDDFDDACIEGNKLMAKFESRFPMHVFPDSKGVAKKERFSKNGCAFGSPKDLITDSAYLKTPFRFYAQIKTLKMDDIDDTVDSIVNSIKKYRKYKLTN